MNSSDWNRENQIKLKQLIITQIGENMEDREIALILFNMQLDMDYGDAKPYGKEEVDMLEEEIATLRKKDSPLFYVLENIILRKNVYYSPDATDTKTGPV